MKRVDRRPRRLLRIPELGLELSKTKDQLYAVEWRVAASKLSMVISCVLRPRVEEPVVEEELQG